MKRIVLIIMCGLLLWSGYRLWYGYAIRPVDADSDARISVTIQSGTSTSGIADILEEKGLIRSAFAFKAYVKKEGLTGTLQAGTFVLQPSMPVSDIASALSSGQTNEQSVTIPEGFTVKDMDELLAEKGLITSGELMACANDCDFSSFGFLTDDAEMAPRGGMLEGYLYPDTYFVDASDFQPKFFLERLLGVFRQRVVNDLAADIQASGRTLHEIVTMASLIEEETRTDAERPVVSGILWKRYNEGIGLYVDASNRYILDKPTATITAKDLEMDSPYNLRKYQGLPPGAIANPSLASIKAALHPVSSPYYYYLHGADGVIRYAVTNEEHNVNRAKYIR